MNSQNAGTIKKNVYDLEDRTLLFARKVREFVKMLPRSIALIEDSKQLIRASGSIGANYIEANESLGKKDFLMRIRIARKEAKECRYWLQLIVTEKNMDIARNELIQEAKELMLILSSIMRKSSPNNL